MGYKSKSSLIIHVVVMKCLMIPSIILVGSPLLILVELLWRIRTWRFKNWCVGVGGFVYQLHSPEFKSVLFLQQEARGCAWFGTIAVAYVWYDSSSPPGDCQHLPCNQSSHLNSTPVKSCLQCSGPSAVCCFTSWDSLCVSAGSRPPFPVPVSSHSQQDSTIWVSPTDQSWCDRCSC
jgi:hypothetical protein